MSKVISLFATTDGMSEEQIKLLETEYRSDSGCGISVFEETRTYYEGELDASGSIYLAFQRFLKNKYEGGSSFMTKGQWLENTLILYKIDRKGEKKTVCRIHQDYPLQVVNKTLSELKEMSLTKQSYKFGKFGWEE